MYYGCGNGSSLWQRTSDCFAEEQRVWVGPHCQYVLCSLMASTESLVKEHHPNENTVMDSKATNLTGAMKFAAATCVELLSFPLCVVCFDLKA